MREASEDQRKTLQAKVRKQECPFTLRKAEGLTQREEEQREQQETSEAIKEEICSIRHRRGDDKWNKHIEKLNDNNKKMAEREEALNIEDKDMMEEILRTQG